MKLIKEAFYEMDKGYMVKQYLIGIILYLFFVLIDSGTNSLSSLFIFTFNLIVYPFTKYFWLEISNFFLGERTLYFKINLIYIIVKFIKSTFIFAFGFIVFPLSMIIIKYRLNENKE